MTTLLAFAAHGGMVQQKAINVGPGLYEYDFQLIGFSLTQGEALDIEFDPSIYLSLSNPSAPAGFSAIDLQPNNPPGTPGDVIFEENGNGPVNGSAGPFSVQFTLSATGGLGPVSYSLYSIDNNGAFGNQIQVGTTTFNLGLVTPEPGSFLLAGMVLCAVGIGRKRWLRS